MSLFAIVLLSGALTVPAIGDDVGGQAMRHPVIRNAVAKVTLDCVVRADMGLQDCVLVSATPAAAGKAEEVRRMFERAVHVALPAAAIGHHKSFVYSWPVAVA